MIDCGFVIYRLMVAGGNNEPNVKYYYLEYFSYSGYGFYIIPVIKLNLNRKQSGDKYNISHSNSLNVIPST